MHKCCSIFLGVILLSVGRSIASGAAVDLIVPQEISYSYGGFSFTRAVSVSGTNTTVVESGSNDGAHSDNSSTSVNSTEHRESDKKTELQSPGGNLGEALGAAVGGGFLGDFGASIGSVLGGAAYSYFCPGPLMKTEKYRERQDFWQTANVTWHEHNNAHYSNHWNAHSRQEDENETYGNWYLKFTVEIRGNFPRKRYQIGSDPKMWIVGLSRPVQVHCSKCQGKEFGIDGIRFPLDVEIRDTQLLREVSDIAACARRSSLAWHRLSVEIRASDCPIISVETGKNILEAQSAAMWEIPTTAIALEYGEASACSPWQVCRRKPDNDRAKTTVREALNAINADASSRRRVSTNTFNFSEGRLVSISEMPLVFPNGKMGDDFLYWGVRTIDENKADGIAPVCETRMDKPIGDYEKISFVRLSLAQTVRTVFSNENLLAGVKADMLSFLSERGKEDGLAFWNKNWRYMTRLRDEYEARHRKPEIPAGALKRFVIDGEPMLTLVYCPSNAICHAFWIGQTEVSQLLWKRIMGRNPSSFRADGNNKPVENITVDDCKRFLQALGSRLGPHFRLPTAAEWEYACRAGTATNVPPLTECAWYGDNAQEKTHPVGGKSPNAWGIYDMLGNVLEFTADTSADGVVLCGGSYLGSAEDCCASFRDFIAEGSAPCIGLRIALDDE